jgi:3-hydroxymyristoyl/3-hydroxydecanoyl-(acyl carrier protein) dehydratase
MASLDIEQIMTYLPHRPPMLLIDRIVDYEIGKWSIGGKKVTEDEVIFVSEEPDKQVMPAMTTLEVMNQTAAMILLTEPSFREMTPILGGFEHAKFKRPIRLGDDLIVRAELRKFKRNVGRIHATAIVDGVEVASADIISTLVPQDWSLSKPSLAPNFRG